MNSTTQALVRVHLSVLGFFLLVGWIPAQDASIEVYANQVTHPLSRYLTGACIEDVNHEIYGGIYSQMIFGESFQEPAPAPALKGFNVFGGRWEVSGESLAAEGGDGPKAISDLPAFTDGEVGVEVKFPAKGAGNAGLILRVSEPGNGSDRFDGYEISLEPAGNLVLGRHRHNWEPIRRAPCAVLIGEWNKLSVQMAGPLLEVFVNGQSVIRYEDTEHSLGAGTVGLRTWQHDALFRNLSVRTGDQVRSLPFEFAADNRWADGVSGMWRAMRRSNASGNFAIVRETPFVGTRCQRITFQSGDGEIGIENQSLNRWGMNFIKGRNYEGCVWIRSTEPTEFFVALESRDGEKIYAEQRLKISGGDWRRVDFKLKPNATDTHGRFAIKLKKSGTLDLGYVFLQPGKWGRFKNLPVRKDVAEGLIDQGITVLRYGGSMVNHQEYQWKKMIGPRERRPPYHGTWYAHSSNGWGIFDFLNFCEAAGFAAIPDLNANETPQDMADFIEYVNGPTNSEWGRKRVQDGHPKSYHLKYIEIGNEESVNDSYYEKFEPLAKAIWAKDPNIILIVGDFAYGRPITDAFNFSGADGRITTLAAHQKILRLAKQYDREVWFDVHVGTKGPKPNFDGTLSYIDALDKIAKDTKHRVVIFEFNANNPSHRRALANAAAINIVERDGRLPIATSANCLQPDGQNDNGWNQGLLFLNPSRVWLQPPGYVTQMISRHYQPLGIKCDVRGATNNLDVSAKRSEDGKTFVLQVVNFGAQPQSVAINLHGFVPSKTMARAEELAGPLDARNTAESPKRIAPVSRDWPHEFAKGQAHYTFPGHSFTVLELK